MTSDTFQRKLTAILSADVVGYSRLMGDDEAATVKTLETYKVVMFILGGRGGRPSVNQISIYDDTCLFSNGRAGIIQILFAEL